MLTCRKCAAPIMPAMKKTKKGDEYPTFDTFKCSCREYTSEEIKAAVRKQQQSLERLRAAADGSEDVLTNSPE